MKKFILIMFVVVLLPITSSAATNEETQRKIDELTQVVLQLQAILTSLIANTPTSLDLDGNLYVGDEGAEVTRLQTFLHFTGDFTYPDITGYYGQATVQAVQRYQCRKLKVCSGTPDSNGYGVVGSTTRLSFAQSLAVSNEPTTSASDALAAAVEHIDTTVTALTNANDTPAAEVVTPTSPITSPAASPEPTALATTPEVTTQQTSASCTPLPTQTRVTPCDDAAKKGSITQSRASVCPVNASAPVWTIWSTSVDSCVSAPLAPTVPEFSSSQLFSGQVKLVTPARYSFGSSVDSSGNIYFTEYGQKQMHKYMPSDGRDLSLITNQPGIFGIAATDDGTTYIGINKSENFDGKVIQRSSNGSVKTIIPNLRRIRQLSIGSDKKLYVTLEGEGQIIRWDPKTKQVEVVVEGLNTPQGAVEKDGVIYWSEYGKFWEEGNYQPGRIAMRAADGTMSTVVSGIWRNRGISILSDGTLIVTSEANKWDQGNSGYILSVKPGQTPKILASGLDYPQFPSVSDSDDIYITSPRDDWMVSYSSDFDPNYRSWPGGLKSYLTDGSVKNSGSGDEVSITVGNFKTQVVLSGNESTTLKGWLKIPAEYINISKVEFPYWASQVAGPGIYEIPESECIRSSGSACSVKVVVERVQGNSRWPMVQEGHNFHPAAGFSEAPTAYWVYIDSDPVMVSTKRNWPLMAPSLERYLQRHFEGLLQRKVSSFSEMKAWFTYVQNAGFKCKETSKAFLNNSTFTASVSSLSDTQTITRLHHGLLGINPDSQATQKYLSMLNEGKSWPDVWDSIMETDLYGKLCTEDWNL